MLIHVWLKPRDSVQVLAGHPATTRKIFFYDTREVRKGGFDITLTIEGQGVITMLNILYQGKQNLT